jgi:DNA-binding NarL/FixJ family response regulator
MGEHVAETTTVALIDDHRTLLDLLTFAISAEDDLDVVGTATTAAEGLLLVGRTEPDVVLLDLLLPDSDGVAVASTLAVRHPRIRVVMLTACQDAELIARAAGAGVAALVAKSGALHQLLDLIRASRSRAMIVDPALLAMLQPVVRPRQLRPAEAYLPALTAREQSVLTLLSHGKDARVIAHELSISLHTCRGHLKSILMKLDSHSQLEAVVKAGRLGMLSAPELAAVAG